MTSAAPDTPSPGTLGPDAGPDVGPWRAPVAWEPADGHTGRAAYLAVPTPAPASTSSAAAKRAPARGPSSSRARRAPASAGPALEEVAAPSAQQLRDRPGAVLLAAVCACGWVGPTAALPSPPRPARAPQRDSRASRRDRRRQGATASGAGGAGDTGGGGGMGAGELVERDRAWLDERDQAAAALVEQWRAHLDQEVPSLEVAVAIAERDATIAAAHAHVDDVVRRARNRDDPVTWNLIGKAEGITRAGAFNRWGAKP